MENFLATVDEALTGRWKIVDVGGQFSCGFTADDISIATESGKEVVGSSEWMRAERAVFEHIVELHNKSIG